MPFSSTKGTATKQGSKSKNNHATTQRYLKGDQPSIYKYIYIYINIYIYIAPSHTLLPNFWCSLSIPIFVLPLLVFWFSNNMGGYVTGHTCDTVHRQQQLEKRGATLNCQSEYLDS
uniref:Uncharacterized protein n=1 Tax=Trypanosoma vivax (strain Y486) TaxID=1055687 RepID=G0TU55_TRYVY|nr:hypothetical protein TVY486_0401550 [Trypanosoma vivax Y486]